MNRIKEAALPALPETVMLTRRISISIAASPDFYEDGAAFVIQYAVGGGFRPAAAAVYAALPLHAVDAFSRRLRDGGMGI
jgi:hypothetical protein